MEINIGIRESARELTVDVELSHDEIQALIAKAVNEGEPLRLDETNGRTVIVPAQSIGSVEIAANQTRRVGFGF